MAWVSDGTQRFCCADTQKDKSSGKKAMIFFNGISE
jgi:hypothetical protein